MSTLPFEAAELTNRSTIAEIVKTYETEIQHIRDAYAALERAAGNLTAAFGRESSYSHIDALPRQCHGVESALKEVLGEIKRTCWRNLIDRLGIRRVISLKRAEELESKLRDVDKLPEITVQTVYETLELITANANDFFNETVKEVYRAFHITPHDSDYWHARQLKTNLRNATEDLGKKIVSEGTVRLEWGGGSYRVEYGTRSDKLRALDKVFHALDGQPFSDAGYISPLIDAIHTSGPDGKGETPYFKFKCYQNGNLHLEFKRLDLLKEFNRIANDGTALKSGRVF